jgi:hypothetical protein
MSVKVRWYDDNEDIILYTFIGIWSWEEYDEVNKIGRAMMRTKPHYVGVMCDLREGRITPTLLTTKVNNYIKSRPENTGVTMFVSTNMFFTRVYETLTRIYPSYLERYQMRLNYEEAVQEMREWLNEHRDTTFETH